MRQLLIKVIEFYQKYLSFDRGALSVFCPGGACKQSPTCSEYTKTQVLKYGVVKGLISGGKRIISCR